MIRLLEQSRIVAQVPAELELICTHAVVPDNCTPGNLTVHRVVHRKSGVVLRCISRGSLVIVVTLHVSGHRSFETGKRRYHDFEEGFRTNKPMIDGGYVRPHNHLISRVLTIRISRR